MPLPTFFPLVAPTGYVEFEGRQVYAGMFKSAGAIAAPSIAAWDGTSFSPMGNPGMWAQSLVVWNGVLYAAGPDFQGHGFVSRWDGSSWTHVGTATGGQFNSPVTSCLEVFNGDLVVAGDFSALDGIPALRVARFDGASWYAMGAGLASKPNNDLQAVGSDLYVGTSSGIRRWDGSAWVDVGPGLQGTVTALTTDGTNLYAAGSFSKAGADSVPGVGRWDGTQWQRVGVGTSSASAITWWNGQLVAGVRDGSSNVSRFDGTNWSGLGGPYAGINGARLLGTFGTQLVALGLVQPSPTGDVMSGAVYDGSTWTPLREPWSSEMTGIDRAANAATVWNDRLVVVGEFTGVGSGSGMLRSPVEAMWDGASWSTFGTGTGAGPQALCAAPWGSTLAVGGYVSSGITSNQRGVALWNGSAWQLPGTSTAPYAYALVDHLGDLYAGGDFHTIPGPMLTVNLIARWNGTSWSALGSGLEAFAPIDYPSCYALTSWSGLVVAGGEFDHAGGLPTANIAAWNGAAWSNLGAGLDEGCYALTVWNGNLIAGGEFTHAGGVAAPGAAMWDGATWQPMGDNALFVVDFAQIAGTLYAVGDFRSPEGATVNTVARWTGTHWQLLGSGAPGGSFLLYWVEGYHDDLYAGGSVGYAFGKVTAGIFRLPAANTVSVDDGPAVAGLSLAAAPNPSGASTTFSFMLPQAGRARLAVYDAAGREVARLVDGDVLAGRHEVRWTVAARPGVYFACLDGPGGVRRVARVARVE